MRPHRDDAGIRRYLLGLLPEAEADALEEAYLADPDLWERVRGVENDLLDDYAADRLGPQEKGAFEGRYLASPRLRERVLAARALRAVAESRRSAAPSPTRRPAQWGVPLGIAASLLLAVVAFWPGAPGRLASTSTPPATLIAGSDAPVTQSSAPAAAYAPPALATPAPVTRPLVLALSPVLLRGQARRAELRIPPGTNTVVLELEGDPAALRSSSALEVTVKTVEGEPVWRGAARRLNDAARPSRLVAAEVPAANLPAGDYLVTLSTRGGGDGTLYSFFFRVGR